MSTKKKYTVTRRAIEQRQGASRKHGIFAIRDRGIEAMETEQVSYFTALRKNVERYPDRLELRYDLAAMAQLLAELFFGCAIEDVESGMDVTDSPAVKRLGYHIGLAERILANLPDEDDKHSAAELITQKLTESGEIT